MPQRRPRFTVLLAILISLVLTGACSSPTTLPSRTASEAPSVDGALGDWDGSLTYVGDKAVSMSAAPTDSLLYVALAIQDRRLIRSVAANGLVLWVDPAGGQQQTYGIQYPIGLRSQQMGQEGASSAVPGAARPASLLDEVNLRELEVVRGDSARRRIPAHFSSGLRARATLDPGSLIYELAIPVGGGPGAGRQHGLRGSLGGTVGIGLTTPEPKDDDATFATQGAGGPSVTARPGRGRTRRGRRRRRRRPERESRQPEMRTLDLWTKVVAPNGTQ